MRFQHGMKSFDAFVPKSPLDMVRAASSSLTPRYDMIRELSALRAQMSFNEQAWGVLAA